MRQLVTIRTIRDIKSIPDADRIELAFVDGWQVVVAKGQFKIGDSALYFEIDSALPADDPRYEFLHKTCLKEWSLDGKVFERCVRIKTTQFRGVLSQGLLMPLDQFEELRGIPLDSPGYEYMAQQLRVRHYDKVAQEADIKAGKIDLSAGAKGHRPSFLPDYDPDRLQNHPEYFDKYRGTDYRWEITEKFDGTACTIWYSPEMRPDCPYGVSSKSLDIDVDHPTNIYSITARKYYKNITDFGKDMAFYGELCGPGINGNRDKYMDPVFKIWHIYDISRRTWLLPQECRWVCTQIGIEHVKVIHPRHASFDMINSMDEFLTFVEGITDRGHSREGMVWKSATEPDVTFKVINNKYLIKEK